MAVNKNFVIKNGIEVDTNLIFADSISNVVGIATTIPNHKFHVIGGIGATELVVSGLSTFASNVDINADVDISGSLTVDGHTELDDLLASGITTVTNIADNVLGTFDNGAFQVLGGAAITKNLSVGAGLSVGLGLSVTGHSFFVGMVTFAGGTDGNITFGDSAGDNVVFNANIDSNIVPDDDDTYDLGSTSQQWRNLYLNGLADLDFVNVSAASTFGGFVDINNSVDISSDLIVTGVSTFTGAVDANGGATIDNIQIGVTGDNEIDTAAGNLVIDSAGGTVTIDDNVAVTGTFSVTGTNVIIDSANIDLGNSVTDTITATARFDSNLVPSTDNARDLGSSSLEWKDLYLDGIGYIDALRVHDTTANTLGDVNTGAVQIDGGTGIAGNLTVGAGLSVTGNSFFVGVVTFAAGTDGNLVLGDSASDNIVFNADVNSNIIPNTDGAYDLGSSGQEWKDLYVDGVAYIDTLQVHETSTFTGNIVLNANLDLQDNDKILIGTGDDLEIYHDGNNSYIHDGGTGGLFIRAANTLGFRDVANSNANWANFYSGGSVELYFNGSKKFETTAAGIVVTGVSTFSDNIDANGNLDVDGHTDLDDLVVTGVTTISNTLNVTGTLNATSDLDVDGHTDLDDLVVTGVTTISNTLNVTGTLNATTNATFSGNIDANGNLDVDGHTELDDLNVAGVSTFVGAIDANGGATIDNIQIGITDNNEIDTAAGNLTIDSAGGTTTIDDNVAVTGTFSVSGSTVNIDSADINLGNATSDIITVTGRFDSNLVPSTDNARDLGLTSRRWRNIYADVLDISGDIDIDGHTELDDVNVVGVTTTQTLHVGTAGTTLTVDPESSTFAIGSASVPVTATMNGGAIPSIGLVIALGG